jgi:hypothetical protein
MVAEAPAWSLVGKVGDSGVPFFVGHGTSVIAETGGMLFLSMNESSGDPTSPMTLRTTPERGRSASRFFSKRRLGSDRATFVAVPSSLLFQRPGVLCRLGQCL